MAARGADCSSVAKSSLPVPSDEELAHQAHVALKQTFGFDAFRGRQLDAIMATLRGQDAFVLMPTGGGKSLCYALVPAIRPGIALVVSPLIALMQDQVQALRAKGLRADYLSSARSEPDRRRLLADLQQPTPDTQLLYVTPELLATDSFMRCLRGAYAAGSLLLCAIDEAHCMSSWGHSFRHTYRRLWVVRQELPRLPLMALTATASDRVQQDILSQLRLRDPLMLRASFNRPNIRYEVRYLELLRGAGGQPLATPLPDIIRLLEEAAVGSEAGTQQQQQQQRKQQEGEVQHQQAQLDVPCSIIYCHKRQEADRVAAALRKRGIACAAYHAGLPDATRTRVLEEWQARRLAVVAGTVAFGMGIDRGDVRYVIHHSLPKSLEGFYQEAGRAGRDGASSRSIVYCGTEDRQRQEFVLSKGDEKQDERSSRRGGSPADEEHPKQLQQFGQVVDYCLSAHCRRATVLRHFGERAPAAGASAAARAACCDVCADGEGVAAALRELASTGAQRRQRFAGGKHVLDFGGGGGGRGGGILEFETTRPHEGLDYDQEGPSRALQDSDEEDAIGGSSSDEEGAAAAAAAMHRAQRGGRSGSGSSVFAALERAEEQHEQQQAGGGSKKARLLHKLEGGGGGGGGGVGGSSWAAGPSGSAGASSLTDANLQAASRQLAAVLSGNAALATTMGGSAAAIAAALVQQLAAGTVSKPVFQSKLSNLAMQLRKAGSANYVPMLAAALGSANGIGSHGGADAQQAGAAAAATCGAGGQAGGAEPPAAASAAHQQQQQRQQQQQQLEQQVAAALRLAAAASPGSGAAVDAAAAALQALAACRVSVDLLQATGAGKKVQQLKRHASPRVAQVAAAVVAAWKAQLVEAGTQ